MAIKKKNAVRKKVLRGISKKASGQASHATARKKKVKTASKSVRWSKKKSLEKVSGTTGGSGSPVRSGIKTEVGKTSGTTGRKGSPKKFNKRAHTFKKGSGTKGGSGSPVKSKKMLADGKISGTTGGKGSPVKKDS